MSETGSVLEQLAAIKQMLLDNAAQHSKCLQNPREDKDKGPETDSEDVESLMGENLKKIIEEREQTLASRQDGAQPSPVSIDALRQITKENHDTQMSLVQEFFKENAELQLEQRALLLREISRQRVRRRHA